MEENGGISVGQECVSMDGGCSFEVKEIASFADTSGEHIMFRIGIDGNDGAWYSYEKAISDFKFKI